MTTQKILTWEITYVYTTICHTELPTVCLVSLEMRQLAVEYGILMLCQYPTEIIYYLSIGKYHQTSNINHTFFITQM